MDGVSTAFGAAKSVYDAYNTVKTTRKEFKQAPEKLQLLEDDRDLVRKLFNELSIAKDIDSSGSHSTSEPLEHLQQSLERRSDDLDQVISKVMKQSAAGGDKTGRSVRLFKFLLNKDDIKDASSELKELREMLALRFYMDHTARVETSFVDLQTRFEDLMYKLDLIYNTVSLTQLTAGADEAHAPANIQSTTSDNDIISSKSASRSHSILCGPLHCLKNCHCRCHARSLSPLIPQSLASYVGQLFVSKQLLHPAFTPWNCCNVETCRGTYLKPAKVTYTLPQWSLFYGSFQSSSNQRIHFSINAYRTVPYSSPTIEAIRSGDVHEVRDLFAKQQASIWDVDIEGNSILWFACEHWQNYPTENGLEIVRFLVEAGADALLFADTETTYSAHDILAIGLFAHLLRETDPGRSFTAIMQTNSAAIAVFRSIFNMDALDALQDLLSRRYGHSDEDVSHLLTSLETTEYTTARSSVFDAILYTPLEYAIRFSPSSVESLLAEGADAAGEPSLAYAARYGSSDLIALLINNGADVNMKDSWGRTALHWTCYWCYYITFCELVRCAEDEINWDVHTPEGQSALDLFDEGVLRGHASGLTSAHVDEFCSILVSHMDPSQLQVVEDEPLNIPGAFPVDTES